MRSISTSQYYVKAQTKQRLINKTIPLHKQWKSSDATLHNLGSHTSTPCRSYKRHVIMLVAQGRVLFRQVSRMMTASCLSKDVLISQSSCSVRDFRDTRTDFSWGLVSYPHLSHWHILAFDYGRHSLVCFSRGTQESTVAGDDASLSLSLVLSFFYSVRGQMTSSLLL